ncbi:MAG: triose-phosphate isomerase [Bacteroidota bacterium]
MRPKFIAGNWKMFKTLPETEELVKGVVKECATLPPAVLVAICPPFTSLALAATLLKGSAVRLGAQNMSEHDEGAFTGEISWKMLKSVGCAHVILGHSERRQYYGETDEKVNAKAKKALTNGLDPIICVGETLKEREDGVTSQVITRQVKGVLAGIPTDQMAKVVIAYEPVWAIGTGKNATPAQAEEVHALIRDLVRSQFTPAVADAIVIQYGGSVKPDNAAELLRQKDIDGALVGGACLKAESFGAIIKAAR